MEELTTTTHIYNDSHDYDNCDQQRTTTTLPDNNDNHKQ